MISCFKGKFRVTSGFRTAERPNHNGLDLVGIDDTTVYAPCDGVIGASTIIAPELDTGRTWEWGNYVQLDVADGYSIYMCHMASRAVSKGQKVKKGEKLGIMGNTGNSQGAHTHFEVRKTSTNKAINPCDYSGIPNKEGVYECRVLLESGNDIVWELMNSPKYKVEITEAQRAIRAIDKAKDSSEFMSLYWILYKIVNGNKT